MAYTDCSNVCTHLTLESGSSSKKRKHDDKVHIGSRKKACNNEVGRSWGYSTELMFYDDPWKIKKILRESDLGNLSTLLLESGSSSKNRKHDDKEHIGSRKKACSNEVDMSWGYSTELMLSDDPWKIKKILKESDLGNLSTFLLGRDLAQELVLPVLGVDVDLDNGTQVMT
ncbi:hypothetical protein SESBI_47179 [Sesbania bispinosa]|nr:hypothetical protein SESBI_47179 [Sesbania bispinosa]